MTTGTTETRDRSNVLRSIGAVVAGLLAIFVLSLGTDQIFHSLGVYPPWGEPMRETGDNLLALAYRCIYAIFGCYLAARLAPQNPMRHALILGGIGMVLSTLGAVGATQMDLGPLWYPVSLVLTSLPCAWLGGYFYSASTGR